MVTIRLSRGGAKKQPFYHIVATDSRALPRPDQASGKTRQSPDSNICALKLVLRFCRGESPDFSLVLIPGWFWLAHQKIVYC